MRHFLLTIVIVLVIAMGLSSCLCQPRYASFANDKSCLTSNPMHIAENSTVAKSLPPLR